MTLSIPLDLVTTPQILPIPGGSVGSHMLYLAFATAPSAGTVKVEYRPIGATAWKTLSKVNNVSITSGELAFRLDGVVGSLRLTFTGLVGGAGPLLWFTDAGAPSDKLFVGLAAMTVQTYLEANVKNGLQFFIQLALPQLAALGTHKLLFTTGAKQVLVKAREMYGLGQFISLQVYKQPNAPAPLGTLVAVQNYDDVAPVATTVTIRSGVTTVSDGTPWGDPQRLFGSSQAGGRVGSGLAPGGDRRLKANSTYLVVFRNTDSGGSGTADIDYFLSWFEGDSDLPL